jgi:peptidyl-tRNA hydrolase, PTH1 family
VAPGLLSGPARDYGAPVMRPNVSGAIHRLFGSGSGTQGASSQPWVVVGLGNPGPEYDNTRHNVGFECIEELARRAHVKLGRADRRARASEAQIEAQRVILVAPRTYVNESGVAVRWALDHYRSSPERLIVILDEINLEPGTVRIRRTGSAGGHNGMKSILASLGGADFARVRIGVGRPQSAARQVEHVLSTFSRADRLLVDGAVGQATDAVVAIIRDGIESAMNQFN